MQVRLSKVGKSTIFVFFWKSMFIAWSIQSGMTNDHFDQMGCCIDTILHDRAPSWERLRRLELVILNTYGRFNWRMKIGIIFVENALIQRWSHLKSDCAFALLWMDVVSQEASSLPYRDLTNVSIIDTTILYTRKSQVSCGTDKPYIRPTIHLICYIGGW